MPYNISAREQNNRLSLNPNLPILANVLLRVCFIAPDGTDLRKVNRVRSSFLKKVRLYRWIFYV